MEYWEPKEVILFTLAPPRTEIYLFDMEIRHITIRRCCRALKPAHNRNTQIEQKMSLIAFINACTDQLSNAAGYTEAQGSY